MKYVPEIALGYKDVSLIPNKCVVKYRSMVNTGYNMVLPRNPTVEQWETMFPKPDFMKRETTFDIARFKLPIMPANMTSVIDCKTYELYRDLGVIPIMHRFDMDPVGFLTGIGDGWKAISVGIGAIAIDQLERVSTLTLRNYPDCICIDIAHGHSDTVKEIIEKIKDLFKAKPPLIIAGNVTTPDAVIDLQNWGANMIKVGIGGGHVCSTKNETGFHVPMFTAVKNCAEVATVPIIADGGIKEHGDIAKALVAGADIVMVGGLFAACSDSPADIIDGKKEYYGSASEKNKGYNKHVEGFTTHLTPTYNIATKIQQITESLQSSISYAGGKDLSALDLGNVGYNIIK